MSCLRVPGVVSASAASQELRFQGLARWLLVPCICSSWVVCSTLSYAQTADVATDRADVQLQEVVVTATKRVTTLQGTPISLTAISGDSLSQRELHDINSLIDKIPGVSYQTLGPGRANYSIRGVSSSGGSSPTVGFYLDDIPVTPATSAQSTAGKAVISPDLYDLERVEVLRGPQGTLYGSGSEGGTIRLITNQPKLDTFQSSAQASIAHTARSGSPGYGLNGMLNVPLLSNRLALRVVGSERYDAGYIDRIVVSPYPAYTNGNTTRGDVAHAPVAGLFKDVNSVRTGAVRALMLWQPSDNLKITPSVFLENIHQLGQSTYDLPPGNFAHYQAGNIPESFDETFTVYGLNVKYEVGPVAINNTTSLMQVHFRNSEDISEQWYGIFVPFGDPFLTQASVNERHTQRQFSEELRLSSLGEGAVQWLGGVFYNDFKDTISTRQTSDQLIAYYGTNDVFTDREPDHLTQSAVFGELTYAFNPQFKATVGLRYFHYSYDFLQNYSGLATAPPQVATGSTAASGTSPKVSLAYTPTADFTLFANAAKGFRPGSANLPIPPMFCGADLKALGAETYSPDTVWSFEVGEKARLLDQRIGLRASVYYISWRHIQQNVPLSCGYAYTTNAGGAVSKGGEFELDVRLSPSFTLHANLGHTDAKITSSSVGNAIAVGSLLPNVPRWTGSAAIDYATTSTSRWNLTAHADYGYVGPVFDPNSQPFPLRTRAGYGLVNARIGLKTVGGLEVGLFANNLFNKLAYVGFNRSSGQNTMQYARVIPTVPRTIGVDVMWAL